MKNLRKAARGRDCTVRLPFFCNHDPATTTLAHIRRAHVAGVGMKPPDVCAVIACSRCADWTDHHLQPSNDVERTALDNIEQERDTYILEAMCRTLSLWSREGFI